MVNIERSHNDEKIVESLKKLRPTLNFADGAVKAIAAEGPAPKRRYVDVTVRYTLTSAEFDQVLNDSVQEPQGRQMIVLQ